MRRLFLIFAFIAALVAGWSPAMASVQAAGARHADHISRSDHGDHDNRKHGVSHPLLCSACFALAAEAQQVAPASAPSARHAVTEAVLAGGDVLPLVPPPRKRTA